MYQLNYDVREEYNKDLQRDAENGRLVRQTQSQNNGNVLNNARKALGRNLVQVGQQLLNER